ncbi:MAG: PEGA domain-containing protein [Myxococcales bacterium]|nr:PEGA domain-containing protein [Myxococcales bacterium]MCB9549105.1 PEGA domain-containing protein [Myxococcales bacterium]
MTPRLLVLALLAAGWPWAALARDDDAQHRVVALVFAREGADENAAVRIERDLRQMFDTASKEGKKGVPPTFDVEPRFDVGYLSKADLEKARMQFNDAQRKIEAGDHEEALEHLFRAERFYNKGIPFVADDGLLRGIFFYYFLARDLAGQKDKARESYCAYVALSRNLAGSAGPIEQFEPLADKCGETGIAGTAELRVRADVDGAHVYVDNVAVGVIGKDVPYANPFLPAGPHLVEVRKAGYARWGTLVSLNQGDSKELKAKLKEARNRADEYDPLAQIVFKGAEAFSDVYINDLLFQFAEKYRVTDLVIGFLEPAGAQSELTLFTYQDGGTEVASFQFPTQLDGHRSALMQYWKKRFGEELDPADAVPAPDRWAPTLFKVE